MFIKHSLSHRQGSQPGINHGQAKNCSVDNHHAELDVVVATLSGGPVGFGDGVGNTNKSLLMRCCDQNGVVLGPTIGLGSIDATWAQGRSPPANGKHAAGAVWSAHTSVGDFVWHYVIAIDVNSSFQLVATDLWPHPLSGTTLMHRPWHAITCADGTLASACGITHGLPDVETGLPPHASPKGVHRWELFTVSSVTRSGVGLLGEIDKVTAVSVRRFVSVNVTDTGGIRCTLAGASRETIRVAFVVGAGVGVVGEGVVGVGHGDSGTHVRPSANDEPWASATVRVVTTTLSDTGTGEVGVEPDGTSWQR